jgi:hypothetical protein
VQMFLIVSFLNYVLIKTSFDVEMKLINIILLLFECKTKPCMIAQVLKD